MAQSAVHIDPEVIASIKEFDWAIRSLAMGEYHGRKQSKRLGAGMEFNQYRPYSQGDDLRRLDWKMYARSNKLYVKESEIETNMDVTFIIDRSKSMTYAEQGWSKLNLSKMLTGVLGFMAMENGDWIALADDAGMRAGNDSRHWTRFLQALQGMGVTVGFIEPPLRHHRAKELFIVLSDLYDHDDLIPFINSLKTPRNEVIVFHLLGESERTLDFGPAVKMRDLESHQVVQMNATNYRASYEKEFQEWTNSLSHEFALRGIDYHQVEFTTPIAQLVNAFVQRRKQLL